ncbi:MAG TPA: PaaI family thioesterase [Acidimicrobiales bacterium]|nr:PaaI family thioesterase [Acidimicrobiales bacterium]
MSPGEATDFIRSTMPLCATLGIRATDAGTGGVRLEIDWTEGLCTGGGVLHGGVIMALADSAGATCAYLNLPEGAAGTTTIESKTNFLGAVRSGTARAEATPLHVGGTTIVVETLVSDDGGRPVAKVTQTQMVLRPR